MRGAGGDMTILKSPKQGGFEFRETFIFIWSNIDSEEQVVGGNGRREGYIFTYVHQPQWDLWNAGIANSWVWQICFLVATLLIQTLIRYVCWCEPSFSVIYMLVRVLLFWDISFMNIWNPKLVCEILLMLQSSTMLELMGRNVFQDIVFCEKCVSRI